MFGVRQKLLTALVATVAAASALPLCASSIYEPNNAPNKAFALPAGQLVVNDDLNGNVGRPDTILGLYDPSYTILMDSDDDTSGFGNGHGSELLDVPLRPNGSAYFRVTGAPDATFVGAHSQLGKYSVTYKIRPPVGEPMPEIVKTEWVMPGLLDNVWLNPDLSKPDWTGYTVDVRVNNVEGPGSGDSLDFFVFSGLGAAKPFMATLTAEFQGKIGLYDDFNNLVATSQLIGGVQTISGFANALGKVKLGVTALVDTDFIGEHAEVGAYTLTVVPEPAAGVLALSGAAAICGLLWQLGFGGRQKRRRRE
jgi:hypothetical protein